jgi:hypothetical protein
MATLIEPPFVPDAGVPPLDDLLFELEPPQPVAKTPTTASTAAAARRPLVPFMSLPLASIGGLRQPSAMWDL